MSDDINVNEIADQLNGKVDLPNNANQSSVDFVVESKFPTSSDPSWYRIYKSGWVEQGGVIVINSASVGGGTYTTKSLTFPIALQATQVWKCQARHDRFNAGFAETSVTTGASVYQVNDSSGSFANPFVIWEVKGMKASS